MMQSLFLGKSFASPKPQIQSWRKQIQPGCSWTTFPIFRNNFLLAEAITKCTSVVFLFFGGDGNIFLGLYSYIMLFTRFRKTTTQCVWIFTELCHYHSHQFYSVFIIPERNLIFRLPQPQPSTNLQLCLFWAFQIHGISQYLSFCD